MTNIIIYYYDIAIVIIVNVVSLRNRSHGCSVHLGPWERNYTTSIWTCKVSIFNIELIIFHEASVRKTPSSQCFSSAFFYTLKTVCKGIENTSVWTVSYFGPCPTNLGAKCLMSRFPYGLKRVSESLTYKWCLCVFTVEISRMKYWQWHQLYFNNV